MARVFVNDTTLTAIADAIREKNGSEDTYKPSQMADAVRGIKSGGGMNFGENITSPNILNLFYALESKECKTGEFTLSSKLPNTETLIVDTGLNDIKGFFYVDCDYSYTAIGNTPEYGVWGLFIPNPKGLSDVSINQHSTYNENRGYDIEAKQYITRGTSRFDGGKWYVTATYNAHKDYTPFMDGHRYKWVAW